MNRSRHDICRKRKGKRFLAGVLAFMMAAALLGGCGNSETPDGNIPDGRIEDNGNGSGNEQTPDQTDGIPTGRYMEEVTDMSESLSGYRNGIYRLSDGGLVITDPEKHMLVSKDDGISWEQNRQDWLAVILRDAGFVSEYDVGTEGSVGVVYMKQPAGGGKAAGDGRNGDGDSENDSEEGSGQDQIEETGSTAGEEAPDEAGENNGTTDQAEDGDEGADIWTEVQSAALVVRPDGTRIDVTMPEQDVFPSHIWIKDDGRIFLGTDGVDLYEVAEDGTCELYLSLDDSPQIIKFVENRMVIDGYNFEELLIYDMDEKSYMEDDALTDFFHENYSDRSFNGGSFYDLFFFPGEEGVLYLAAENGLYRHVLGGGAIERVIDGNLTTFGNPAYNLISMTQSKDNDFIAIFTDGRFVRFVYDPDVPTVPSERIKAYSLKENNALRQAISLYQTANPDVYVEYVIGMGENNAVTKEDAIKKLNTEIMAGNGPDLLILDDLPMESYIEKGLLQDLSPLMDSLTGEEALFDNIVDSFRKEDKVYMVPCDINLPVLLGREQDIADTENLEEIADCVEKIRQEQPGKDIFRSSSPKGIMKRFTPVCAPAWTTADGAVDREAVSEFLTHTKRIYDAQMDGLPEEVLSMHEEDQQYWMTYYGVGQEDYDYYVYGVDELEYMVGYKQLMLGSVGYPYAYAELTSVPKAEGFGDRVWKPFDGQSSNVFYADTLAGINAASQNMAYAEGLFKTLIGVDKVSGNGFPLNREAFEKSLYPNDFVSEFTVYSGIGYGYEDGRFFGFDVYWFGKKLADQLRDWMGTVNTPYIGNDLLEEAVYAAGADYFEGQISLEEAVAEVEKSMAIYMAE